MEQKQHRPLLLVEHSALEDFTGRELCVFVRVCVLERRKERERETMP